MLKSCKMDEELSLEQHMTKEQNTITQDVISDPKMVVDRSVEHLWFSQEDACNVLYHGRVVRLSAKKNGVHSVRLAYWLDSESDAIVYFCHRLSLW